MAPMDGVLIIDKPAGLTSHDVVARVRRILGERRVGHTGTLDPFATGVLVVLVGGATRLAQFLSGAEKEYEGVIRLGYATDTGDLTGTPILNQVEAQRSARSWSDEEIEIALAALRGEIDQVPPMYSAKKQQGRKLYELARRGEEVERMPVRVMIREFAVQDPQNPLLTRNEDGTFDLAVRVVCSAGTYVRTLAEDLGKQLGVGAHLVALRRTRAGDFSISDAVTIEALQQRAEGKEIGNALLSMDTALSRFPFIHLTEADANWTRNGRSIGVGNSMGASWADGEKVRMRGENGRLIAVGYFDATSRTLQPRVVMTTD
jgi:tRNA pseudouridine55 synthase